MRDGCGQRGAVGQARDMESGSSGGESWLGHFFYFGESLNVSASVLTLKRGRGPNLRPVVEAACAVQEPQSMATAVTAVDIILKSSIYAPHVLCVPREVGTFQKV